MLEAICTYRERLGAVVMMYVPGHRGFSANSYADAAAKMGTRARMGDVSAMIRLQGGREMENACQRDRGVERRRGMEVGTVGCRSVRRHEGSNGMVGGRERTHGYY